MDVVICVVRESDNGIESDRLAEVDFIVVRESDNGIESERDVDVVSVLLESQIVGLNQIVMWKQFFV